ncbi:MAG: hypothetical protein ISS72_04140 [Candidatus Brocadiae bacterium]|nr:hypothetical protein [Candidatus Brocadiia bacterium]
MPLSHRPSWLFIAVLALAVGAAGAASQTKLVPANFNYKNDSMGFRWDVQPNGTISDGTNDCFDTAFTLTVNGSRFNTRGRPMMTADGREYVFPGQVSTLKVTRRVLLDAKRGFMRYLETLENPTSQAVQATLVLSSNLGGNSQMALSSSGKPFAGGVLGKTDAGIITVSSGSRPCVLFLLASHRSKLKPAISIQNNRTVTFTYRVTVRPRGKATIFHLVAQRRGVTPANAADMFKPIYRTRLVKPEIPTELRRNLVNFHGSGGGGEVFAAGALIQAVSDLAESYGVERGADDVLSVDQDTHLTGTVAAKSLEVETRYGKTQIDLKETALLFGGAGVGRPMRLHLRNGEVLAGILQATDLTFETQTGMTLALDPARVNLLFLHGSKEDGKASETTAAYVRTHQGDRLAVGTEQPVVLDAATAWGPLSIPLDSVRRLAYARDPQPGLRLLLANLSRFPVVLRGKEIALRTLRFGEIKLSPYAVAGLTRIFHKKPDAEEPDDPDDNDPGADIEAAHCTLAGEHVLVGTIDTAKIHVVTATGVTPVDSAQIHRMERADDESPAAPTFSLELMAGGTLTGPLEERLLAVKCGKNVLRVPAEQIVAFYAPKPEVKEEEAEDDEAPEEDEKPDKPKPTTAAPPRPSRIRPAPKAAPATPATTAAERAARIRLLTERLARFDAILKKMEASGAPDSVKARLIADRDRMVQELAVLKKEAAAAPPKRR